MTDSAFYVYAYFRLDGSPCYIGKGKGNRWRHQGKSGRNLHFRRICEQAKKGGQNLPCEKLADGISEQEALALEMFFIAAIGRRIDGSGPLVNLSIGGESGFNGGIHREESKAITSAKLKGRPKTPEHIAAAAAGQRGCKKSFGWWSTEEGRAKQRTNNPRYGAISPHSEETKVKIRAARVLQTNFGKRSKDYQPSAETRARLSAAATADWALRRADQVRKQVTISNTWASHNSVRYSVATA